MKNIIVARDLQPLVLSVIDPLGGPEFEVRTASSGEEILKLHLEKNANLIISHPALPGMACKTLCDIIRRGEALKKVSLLLIADNSPQQQGAARACPANAVLNRPVDVVQLADKVHQLLDVPPRHPYHVVLNIAADGVHDNRPFLCHLENISTAGLLIRTKEKLPAGGTISCSFLLPDGHRITTNGSVVRSFPGDAQSGMTYFGIGFKRLAHADATAIAAFVEKSSGRQQRDGQDAANASSGIPAQ